MLENQTNQYIMEIMRTYSSIQGVTLVLGKWITFEGIGGSGKSTQVELVYNWLIQKNFSVINTLEPGGTDFGKDIRKMVKQTRDPKLNPFTELMLFQADRHETIKQLVQPGLHRGEIVISDRGPFGTIAYQGFGRGISLDLIDKLTIEATEDSKPHLTVLLDIDPRIAQKRINERLDEEHDQFDLEELEFQENVRNGFIYASKKNKSEQVFIIDGSQSKEEIHEQITKLFDEFII